MSLYGSLIGTHPDLKIWHPDWLSVKDLHPALRRELAKLSGRVLDVGCGTKPYASWMTQASEVIGVDVNPNSAADVIITPETPWPFEDGSFDAVFSSQAFEHVRDIDHVNAEVFRVLKPGGLFVLSIPFYHNEHGVPEDYRRWTRYGLAEDYRSHYEIVEVQTLGGVGSVLGVVQLNWVGLSFERLPGHRKLGHVLWPLWALLCGLLGLQGVVFDALDKTGAFYTNAILIARKSIAS